MILVGDIETDGLYDDVTTIWCAVFKDVETGELHEFTPETIHEIPNLLDKSKVLIMHNGAQFDLPVLLKVMGYSYPGRLVDTLAVSRVERPRRSTHSLDGWGESIGFAKFKFDEWHQYSEKMLIYCRRDVELTHKVAQELDCVGEEPLLRHMVASTLFQNLWKQEQNGWKVDERHMKRSLYMLQHWRDRITRAVEPYLPVFPEYGKEIARPFKRDGCLTKITEKYCAQAELDNSIIVGPFHRVLFRRVSPDRPSEIKGLLLSKGWIPEQWNHGKDGNRTSPKLSIEDSFEGIEGRLGRLLVRYVQCKQRYGIINGWKRNIRTDGRLPSKVVGLTVTSRARHSIIANIPRNTSFFGKWMRKHFIARVGWKLTGVDAVACQLRMLAARMGDDEYTHKILTEDIHVVNMHISGLDNRTDSKTLIYALIFGASNAKLTRILGRSGAPVRAALLAGLPALKNLLKKIEEDWRLTAKRGVTPWGKRDWKDGHIVGIDDRIIPVNSEHKVLMGILQSDEAIFMQYAYNLFHNKLNHHGFTYGIDYGVCCWYHDEIDSEAKPEHSHLIGRLGCESIKQAGEYLEINCPMKGEYKVGDNWAEIH